MTVRFEKKKRSKISKCFVTPRVRQRRYNTATPRRSRSRAFISSEVLVPFRSHTVENMRCRKLYRVLYLAFCLVLTCNYVESSTNVNKPQLASMSPLDTSSPSPFSSSSSSSSSTPKPSKSERRKEKEQLYEAYNLLHTLAQDFRKPFDSPAVLVVGHQTSGKSALIEALMGFQFNQVGGGTKTRRPVALRMQYNPTCSNPVCYLTLENGKEEQKSLADIQAFIEAENKRLERDPSRCFDSREINVRMEYRFCPNMIVIDTPGMLHAPKGKHLTPQQRAIAQAAKEAESLVLSKMRVQDYIILCVEDTTDWKHATTRNVVMQADPDLTRTVLVTTKLDTKLPQFSEAEDLEEFLKAPLIGRLYPHLQGGPFFTTVPSGRVGVSKEFNSNEEFVRSLKQTENSDRMYIMNKIGTVQSRLCLPNVGITKLRTFLETRVEECYRRNVAKIVPLLQSELQHAKDKLHATEVELKGLSIDRLKHFANSYRERFAKELADTIHGSAKASPEEWGETLAGEQLRGGAFLGSEETSTDVWQRALEFEVGDAKRKLYGGAQYHRAIREFTVAVRNMKAPPISEDEIANAAGMGDVHDGVNFMRAACIIAVEKAQQSFAPMLDSLRHRTTHIMRRLFPVVEASLKRGPTKYGKDTNIHIDSKNGPFKELIRDIYFKFVDEQIETTIRKCQDDLNGMTRFVTWDTDGRGGSAALYKSLPTPKRMVEIYSVAVESKEKPAPKSSAQKRKEKGFPQSMEEKIMGEWGTASGKSISKVSEQEETSLTPKQWSEDETQISEYFEMMQLMEEMLAGRQGGRTSTVIITLVQHIISSWRNHFAKTVAMKFNCFFLMPFLDDFPAYLRNELDMMYDGEVNELFDITEARQALQNTKMELVAECEANSQLQRRFDLINSQLRQTNSQHHDDGDDGLMGIDDDSTLVENDFNTLEVNGEFEIHSKENKLTTKPKSSIKRKGRGIKKKSGKRTSRTAKEEEANYL